MGTQNFQDTFETPKLSIIGGFSVCMTIPLRKRGGIKNGKSYTLLERWALCFSSYKNQKLKVKPMSWSWRKKKEWIFCNVYFVQTKKFFKIYVLSQFIVYWTNFQNMHTFTYQKTLIYTLLLLVFKIMKSFSVS